MCRMHYQNLALCLFAHALKGTLKKKLVLAASLGSPCHALQMKCKEELAGGE